MSEELKQVGVEVEVEVLLQRLKDNRSWGWRLSEEQRAMRAEREELLRDLDSLGLSVSPGYYEQD
jgi:hypothetical protein